MAQTLKFGSGTWATKKGSTLAYNDEGGNFKPLPFTYTGFGKGTRVNKEGLIEVVENDRPRIDYTDSEDGVFLLEKAATNLLHYSEAFDNSYWIKGGSSVVGGFTSPKGDLSAFKLVEDSGAGAHFMYRNITSTTVGNYYSASIFVKKGERDYFVLGTQTSQDAYFNLSKGVIKSTPSTISSKITSLSNGYYICSITWVATSTSESIYIYNSADGFTRNYTGDGTSGSYIFGAMLEQSSQSSSYIPTQGTIQTRVQETASGSGNSEVFSDSQGTLFANIAANANDLTSKVISINDNSGSNVIRMGYAASSNEVNFIVRATTNRYSYNQVLGDITTLNKLSISYSSSGAKVFINGFLSDSGALSSLPTGLSQLDFRYGNGTLPFYGKTKEIGYYDEVLTDEELEYMTSYRTWLSMVNELNLNVIYNG